MFGGKLRVATILQGIGTTMYRITAGAQNKVRKRRTRKPNELAVIERDEEYLANLALREYGARRQRTRHFATDLFGEPAWDILLDLFVQRACGKKICVTSATIASAAPPTTALRKIQMLEKDGLVARQRSAQDRRVTYLVLTEKGYRQVGNYLRERAGALAPGPNR